MYFLLETKRGVIQIDYSNGQETLSGNIGSTLFPVGKL